MRIFHLSFWKYMFAKRAYKDIPWSTVLLCRWFKHPAGVVWYNPNGSEPDMHCKNCGDDLS
jgi:hypothetical protein